MKPAGRTVSVKLASGKALDKWHSVFLSSKLINGKTEQGPSFQTCLGADDKNCESVSEDSTEDPWGSVEGVVGSKDDLDDAKAVPTADFEGHIYVPQISEAQKDVIVSSDGDYLI